MIHANGLVLIFKFERCYHGYYHFFISRKWSFSLRDIYKGRIKLYKIINFSQRTKQFEQQIKVQFQVLISVKTSSPDVA